MANAAEARSNDSVVDEPDDGFTTEERAQFEEMQKETSGPATEAPLVPDAPAGEAPAGGEKTPVAADAPATAGAEDDDGEDDKPEVPAPGADPNAKPPRRVSYTKFARTEKELNELRAKLAEKETTSARLDERLKIINEALTQQQPGEGDQPAADTDPEPNPEEDIFGHNQWLKRQNAKLSQRIDSIEQGRQAGDADRALSDSYMNDARVFAGQEPNFVPAYQFLMQSRTVELAEYFFGKDVTAEGASLTPQELGKIKQTIAEEEKALATQAIQQGKSPAQRVFALAKARGYRAAAPAAAADAAQKPNGAAPANGAAKPAQAAAAPGSLAAGSTATPSIRDEIANVKAGQEAALSLSNGGGAPSNPLTPERLANMPEDEFNAMVESMSPAEWKRIAGG